MNKKYRKLVERAKLYAIQIHIYEKRAKENENLLPYLERLRRRGRKLVERAERAQYDVK